MPHKQACSHVQECVCNIMLLFLYETSHLGSHRFSALPILCVASHYRAGLYKQLAELKALVAEYREDPAKNAALKVRAISETSHVLATLLDASQTWTP
jgi:hypothetical protein